MDQVGLIYMLVLSYITPPYHGPVGETGTQKSHWPDVLIQNNFNEMQIKGRHMEMMAFPPGANRLQTHDDAHP